MSVSCRLGPSPANGGTVAAWRDGRALTRAELERQIGGCAHLVDGRRRVVLSCRDSWIFTVGLLGALTAGAEVVLPANDLPATLAGLDGLVLDDGLRVEPARWEREPPRQGRVLFQTSGSTGAPKLVMRTLEHLEAELRAVQARLGAVAGQGGVLATVPHQHAFGLVFKVLWPLVSGRAFHAVRHEMWEDLLAALPADGVVVTSPAHLSRLGGLSPLPAGRRPRLLLSAGAPLSEQAAAEARHILGCAVTEIYGSTETGAVATRVRDRAASAWEPLPGYEVIIGDEGVATLQSEAASGPLGDRLDAAEAGRFHLLGRVDRVVKIDGKRVALEAVEQALACCAEVEAVAALALPDDQMVLGAVVVLSAAGREALGRLGGFRLGRNLRRALADRLEPASLPRRWRFVDALPQGAMGKCRDADLRALFAAPVLLPEVMAVREGEDTVQLRLHIPASLRWFQGHFPGRPILPGVVQLDWAVHFARAYLGMDLPAAREFQVKFMAVIGPGRTVALDLRHDRAKGRLVFSYRHDGGAFSSGTVYTS